MMYRYSPKQVVQKELLDHIDLQKMSLNREHQDEINRGLDKKKLHALIYEKVEKLHAQGLADQDDMDYSMGEDAFQHEISECVLQFDDANPNDIVVLNRDDVEPERVILKKSKHMINDDFINDTIFDDVEDRREEVSSENEVEFSCSSPNN
ncbi:hypothetical protein ACFE04_021467 [Oxalis oulophora]